MKKIVYATTAFAITAMMFGCKESFKKAKDGTEYKIISNTAGKKAVAGNFMALNIIAKYKDSVLFNSVESGSPRFAPYDTAQLPPFFRDIHEGDSLVLRVTTDSLIKHGQAAEFMKKGQYVYQYFKVTKVYDTKEQADAEAEKFAKVAKAKAYKKTTDQITKDLTGINAAQMKIDDQLLKDYIAKNSLQAIKTDWGTYVAITTQGAGDALSTDNVAMVNYTGKTLKDTVFDSNTDPKFGHPEPLSVDMSEFGVIPGWIDGLKSFKKGSKGKILIPSSLAYGKQGSGAKIGPNENLVFDIEVIDIITPEQYKQQMMAKQQAMMEMQQKMRQQQQMQQGAQGQPQPQGPQQHP